MAVRSVLALLLVMSACKQADTDTDPAIQWPAAKPFQVTGGEGSLVIARLDWPENPRLDVFGIFAESLQGYQTAAACSQNFMPCLSELPEIEQVARLNNRSFRPTGSGDYQWVGDTMTVGPVFADFVNDTEEGVAYYRGTTEARPTGDLRVRFGGQWSDFDLPVAKIPGSFEVLEPQLQVGERLDLSGPPIRFVWSSSRDQEVWLWVQGSETRQVYHLMDDGQFMLDPERLGLAPAEVVKIALVAVHRETLDVAGNDLQVLTMSGSAWKGSLCGDFLEVPVEPQPPAPEVMETPLYYGFRFQGIIDDGVQDFFDPATGEPASAQLLFSFYDADFQPVCEITYDASSAQRRAPYLTSGDTELYQSFSVDLLNGRSTCGAIDPVQLGVTDLRSYLEQYEWGFGIGELNRLREPLSVAMQDWETQQSLLYGVYWSKNGLIADEQGFGYASPLEQCYQSFPNAAMPKPRNAELPVGLYTTFPYFIEPVI